MMTPSKQTLGRFSLLLLVFARVALSSPPAVRGRVTEIEDGDKLVIVTEDKQRVKVRLKGIDAPENGQPFFQAAAANLRRLVFHHYVDLDGTKVDRYGYLVAKVLVDKTDVCLEQIRAGYSWHFKRYESEQSEDDRKTYAQAETEARKARRGLWQESDAKPPWDWRVKKTH